MKPILFIDFDGTLCHDRFWQSMEAISCKKIQNFLFGENKSTVNKWMRGIYSSEHINQLISKELNIPFERIWSIFVSDCKNMYISSDVLNRIENLKDHFYTVLATDGMDCLTRFTVPALKLNHYFDFILNSFDNKKFKSDNNGETFLQIVNERGCQIEDCILMDNARTDCDTFSKLGGTAHLITPEKPLAFWLGSLESELVKT